MPVDLEARLAELSLAIDRLKVLYEQYFLGIEKAPPTVARREAEKLLDFLSKQNIGNTAVRFRYLTLLRKWKTYAERWDKVLREIENGTFAPHRRRAERKTAADRERPARRKDKEAEVAAPESAPTAIPGMTERELRELHSRYVEARRAAGDPRAGVKYEALVSSLQKQVPAILSRSRCKEVSFDVVVRDGKVILKAQPRRSADGSTSGSD